MPKHSQKRSSKRRSCKKGYKLRKSYTRKSYTRKDGVRVKGARISSNCIKSTAQPGSSPMPYPKYKGKRTPTRGCPRGYIRRSSYTRKSYTRSPYTRKSGVRVKGSKVSGAKVSSNCIKMRGSHGLRVIPKLRKGELSKFGYSSSASVAERERALRKAVKAYTAISTFRKLNALMVLNKNKNPRLSNIFRRDRDWIKENFM